MKNYSIFAARTPNSKTTKAVVAIFMSTLLALCVAYGYQIPVDCRTVKSGIEFGDLGGDSLSYIHTLIFHSRMPNSMKIEGVEKHSNHTSTPTGAKSVSESNLFPVEFAEFTRQLRTIQLWFEGYCERRKQFDDVIWNDIAKISDGIGEVAYHIGNLVSFEFREATFYQETAKI
jgi:hypothetical protein